MTSHNSQSLKTTHPTYSIIFNSNSFRLMAAAFTKRSLTLAIVTAPLLFVLRFDGCYALQCYPMHKFGAKSADTSDRFTKL